MMPLVTNADLVTPNDGWATPEFMKAKINKVLTPKAAVASSAEQKYGTTWHSSLSLTTLLGATCELIHRGLPPHIDLVVAQCRSHTYLRLEKLVHARLSRRRRYSLRAPPIMNVLDVFYPVDLTLARYGPGSSSFTSVSAA